MTIIKFFCLLTFSHKLLENVFIFSFALHVDATFSKKNIFAVYLGVPYHVLEKMQYKENIASAFVTRIILVCGSLVTC